MKRLRSERGQLLAIVIIVLMIASTLVPFLVIYAQREAVWTAKQAHSTTAFHMAEAGIEKGYLELSLSTANWVNLQNGQALTNYQFDKRYDDLSGGSYTISLTSGPQSQQATVVSIGKDSAGKEVRAIKAVYQNATMGNIAIMGIAGVDVSGNNLSVEWGSIVSPNAITPNGESHPAYYSADNINTLDGNGSALPNCDQPNCWWWHSYYKAVPPTPLLDFNFYKSSAQASGNAPAPCSSAYYQASNFSGTCRSVNGKPFYIEGNWTSMDGPIVGTVIVMGALKMYPPNGGKTGLTLDAPIPQSAWKQYCNDWATYLTTYNTDASLAAAYPSQCPGLYDSYKSPSTMKYTITPVFNGIVYVGGDFEGPQGAGNTDLAYGVLIVKGHVTLNSNSHAKYYYSDTAANALQTTQIILSRASWQDDIRTWPSGL